jgi:hypothetical protein
MAQRIEVRGMAAQTGISNTSVRRYFQLFRLQPHPSEASSCPPILFSSRSYVTWSICTQDRRLLFDATTSSAIPRRAISAIPILLRGNALVVVICQTTVNEASINELWGWR